MLKAESEARSDGFFSAKPVGAAAADSSRLGCSTADKGSVGSQIRGADMDFVFLGFMAAMAVAGLVVGKLAGKTWQSRI